MKSSQRLVFSASEISKYRRQKYHLSINTNQKTILEHFRTAIILRGTGRMRSEVIFRQINLSCHEQVIKRAKSNCAFLFSNEFFSINLYSNTLFIWMLDLHLVRI